MYVRMKCMYVWNVCMYENSWESLTQQEDQISQSERKSTLDIHWKDWCWSWSSNNLATWCHGPTHWKRPSCWERLRAGGEGGDRVWDGWMASPTQWTWVWASSGRWWTGKPGELQSIRSQRVRPSWVTEQQKHCCCGCMTKCCGYIVVVWQNNFKRMVKSEVFRMK